MKQKGMALRAVTVGIAAIVLGTGCRKDDAPNLRNEQFNLVAVNNSGITGTVFLAENLDNSFNITVRLNSSVKDSVHVMNVYTSSGVVTMRLNDIKGTGGAVIGETKNISQAVQSTGNFDSVNYEKVLGQKNTVRVFMSASTPTLIAHGEVGK